MFMIGSGLRAYNTNVNPNAFSFPNYNSENPGALVYSQYTQLVGNFREKTLTRGTRCEFISVNNGPYVLGPTTGMKGGDTVSMGIHCSLSVPGTITCRCTCGTTTSAFWVVSTNPDNPEGP